MNGERPRDFLERHGLLVNYCGPNRHRALAHRLKELGFEVRKVIRRSHPPDQWEVYLGVEYEGLPPAVETFRERLSRALKALGHHCPKAKMKVRLTGFRLKMSFPWPAD